MSFPRHWKVLRSGETYESLYEWYITRFYGGSAGKPWRIMLNGMCLRGKAGRTLCFKTPNAAAEYAEKHIFGKKDCIHMIGRTPYLMPQQ